LTHITNEERRVGIYATGDKPTVANTVKPDTPLETLNLNWKEKDLPERERTKHVHRLHPYLGKFIPQLVEIFLRKYFKPGQTVLDPFCGSGTALVQSTELGINSIGYDISAFNVLLCTAKTAEYNVAELRKEVLDILEKVERSTQEDSDQPTLWKSDLETIHTSGSDSNYLYEWFAPRTLHELLTYRGCLEDGDYKYKDILKIILSRSARSARLTTHYDLDFPKKPQQGEYHCYKCGRICRPVTEAFKFLKRYSLDTIRRVEEFSRIRKEASVIIHHADSREDSFPPIDGVITSPPYVGLIDYHEQHIYAYHLLGLEDRRVEEIGAALNGSSKSAKQQYQQDLGRVFSNTVKSMKPGGRLIVIANDKENLYDEIAEIVGVEVENVLKRHVNRRTGRRASEFYESVFIWKKK